MKRRTRRSTHAAFVMRPNALRLGESMKLEYFADTDSLSVTFRDQPSVDSQELSAGVVIDYDAAGRVVGIDIDNASHKVDLTRVVLNRLPGTVEQEVTQCE